VGKLDSAARDQQMLIRRANVDGPLRDSFTVFCLFYVPSGFAGQQGCQLALVPRIEVLHNYDGRELGIEAAEQCTQGWQPTGRGSDSDEFAPS
jgi:hypothetical protein